MKLFDVSQSVIDAVNAVVQPTPEVIDERNKENKFKKDLHVAKQGIEHEKNNLGITPKNLGDMSAKYGHGEDSLKDNMKTLLKIYKKAGRKVAKEEVEQVDELDVGTLKNYRTAALDSASADPSKLKKRINGYHQASDKIDSKVMSGLGKKAASARHYNEEVETVEEGKMKNDGSTYGVSTPLKTKGKHVSENGRHVAKVRKDTDYNEYRVELHSDGVHQKDADYHTDDKEEAHHTAKAMVAHAQKHEKPLGEAVMVAGGGDENKRKEINLAKTKKAFPNVTHFTKAGHPDWKKHGNPQNEETETVIEDTLISKIINKYNK